MSDTSRHQGPIHLWRLTAARWERALGPRSGSDISDLTVAERAARVAGSSDSSSSAYGRCGGQPGSLPMYAASAGRALPPAGLAPTGGRLHPLRVTARERLRASG